MNAWISFPIFENQKFQLIDSIFGYGIHVITDMKRSITSLPQLSVHNNMFEPPSNPPKVIIKI